jgi:hypothetical protein
LSPVLGEGSPEEEVYTHADEAATCKPVNHSIGRHVAHYGELNAERAAEFKSQWMSLQTPPHPILRHQPKKEAQLSKLPEEMAEFLAGIL